MVRGWWHAFCGPIRRKLSIPTYCECMTSRSPREIHSPETNTCEAPACSRYSTQMHPNYSTSRHTWTCRREGWGGGQSSNLEAHTSKATLETCTRTKPQIPGTMSRKASLLGMILCSKRHLTTAKGRPTWDLAQQQSSDGALPKVDGTTSRADGAQLSYILQARAATCPGCLRNRTSIRTETRKCASTPTYQSTDKPVNPPTNQASV